MFKKLSVLAAKVMIIGSLFFAGSAVTLAQPQCDGAKAVGIAACNDAALSSGLNKVINAIFFIAGVAAVIILVVGGEKN